MGFINHAKWKQRFNGRVPLTITARDNTKPPNKPPKRRQHQRLHCTVRNKRMLSHPNQTHRLLDRCGPLPMFRASFHRFMRCRRAVRTSEFRKQYSRDTENPCQTHTHTPDQLYICDCDFMQEANGHRQTNVNALLGAHLIRVICIFHTDTRTFTRSNSHLWSSSWTWHRRAAVRAMLSLRTLTRKALPTLVHTRSVHLPVCWAKRLVLRRKCDCRHPH